MASKRFDLPSLLLLISFGIGAFIRLFDFNRWSLFNDELSTLFRAKYDSWYEVLTIGVRTDVHPAVNESFIYFWMKIFGDSPFAIRFPYVILSLIGLYFFYQFTKELVNKQSAILSLSILSLTQLFVIYSQLARPYAIGLCLLMIFSFCWLKMIRSFQLKWILLSAVFASLSAMTHYFLALTILLLYLAGFSYFKPNKENLLRYLSGGLLSALLFTPHLELTLHQIGRKGLGWLPMPEDDFLVDFLLYSFNNSWILILVVLVGFLVSILKTKPKATHLAHFSLALVFFISYAIGYYYSVKVSPVIQFSSLIFGLPYLIIFLFSLFPNEQSIITKIYTPLLIGTAAFSLVFQADVLGPKPFGNFEGVADHLLEWKEKEGEELLVFSNSSDAKYLDYFYKQKGKELNEDIDYFEPYDELANASKLIHQSSASKIALGFANVPIPMEVYEMARSRFPNVIEQHPYFNSNALLLSGEEPFNVREYSFLSHAELNEEGWEINESLLNDSIYFTEPHAYEIQSKVEYALTYRNTVENLFTTWPEWLVLSARIKSNNQDNLKMVVSIDREGENIDWRSIDTKYFYRDTEWYEVFFVYPLSKEARKEDAITIYFWNPDGSQAVIDDFKITNYKDTNFDYYQLR